MTGEVQGAKPPPLSWHVKVAPPGSLDEKASVALVWFVFAGGRCVK